MTNINIVYISMHEKINAKKKKSCCLSADENWPLQFGLATSFCSDLKYASANMTVYPLGSHGWLMAAYDQAILRSEQNKVVFNLKATEQAAWSGRKCRLHTVSGGRNSGPHKQQRLHCQ